MARIPDSEIERRKQQVSLQPLVEAQGIELKRHGADLLGLCPFHDDRDSGSGRSPAQANCHTSPQRSKCLLGASGSNRSLLFHPGEPLEVWPNPGEDPGVLHMGLHSDELSHENQLGG